MKDIWGLISHSVGVMGAPGGAGQVVPVPAGQVSSLEPRSLLSLHQRPVW